MVNLCIILYIDKHLYKEDPMKIQLKPQCCSPESDCCKEKSQIDIEFLYLDLSICERCQGSDKNLDDAIALIKPVLDTMNYTLNVRKINVRTERLANHYHFLSSPTIRINHIDIEPTLNEDNCKSCGDLCGDTVDCRVFTYQNKQYHEPPVGMIIDQILKSIYTLQTIKEPVNYQVPENLLKFYRSKESN